jgi:hypothetical protein
LRGPLTREQIATLMKDRKAETATSLPSTKTESQAPVQKHTKSAAAGKPVLPPGVNQTFLARRANSNPDSPLTYRPALFGSANVRFVDSETKSDCWKTRTFVLPLEVGSIAQNWNACSVVPGELRSIRQEPEADGSYDELPSQFFQAKAIQPMRAELKDYIYQTVRLKVRRCQALGVVAEEHQSEDQFRAALTKAAVEKKAAEQKQLETTRDQAIARLEEEKANAPSAWVLWPVRALRWFGRMCISLLALVPEIAMRLFDYRFNSRSRLRKPITKRQLEQITRAATSAGKSEAKEPPVRTKREIAAEIRQLNEQFLLDKESLDTKYDPDRQQIVEASFEPRKADIDVNEVKILWLPFATNASGTQVRDYELQATT